jgi:flagellar assembly protein FliH
MGTVIKAGSVGRVKKRFEALRLNDHMAEARAVVERARAEAGALLSNAESESVTMRETARKEGYATGHAAGQTDGHEVGRREAFEAAKEDFAREQATLVSSLKMMLERLEDEKQTLLDRAERDLLAFAVMIARRVTKAEGLSDREMVARHAAEAVAMVGDFTDLTIRAHPDDASRLEVYASTLEEQFGSTRHVRVVRDGSIVPGGCVVETAQMRVDATLDGQFGQAAELLLGESVPWEDHA